jgi:Zn-dependent protease
VTRQTVFLGRLYGVRVGVHVSWIVVYAFMTVVLARGLDMLPPVEAYCFGALCALLLFASVLAHEFAHALVARRFGVRTDAITLFLLGGMATLDREPATPRADALVALAGPAMSAAIGLVAGGLLFATHWIGSAPVRETLAVVTAYLAVANAVLAAFNLIPAYPMDGGRALRALLWSRWRDRDAATLLASRLGMAFGVLLVSAAVLVTASTHDLVYAWYAVLGAFVLRSGWSQERALRRASSGNGGLPAAA